MKLVPLAALALSLCACASLPKPDTRLDRVVVYRNGVAYFERSAHVTGAELSVEVRAADVDDFLKSLRARDATTNEALPVEYASGGGSAYGATAVKIRLMGGAPHDVRLSYVTEAPAWKPTYRAVIGDDGKVKIEAWAIVDNASGEDWKDVKLAVAASGAMSFRFDLKSVRFLQRETYDAGPLVAPAPPPGGVPYGGESERARVVGEVPAALLDAANASPSARLAAARGAIPRIEGVRDRLRQMLATARQQKDVIKVMCVNDKLSQVAVTLSSARDHLTLLEGGVDRDESDTVTHEAAAVRVLSDRAGALSAEADQCVGEEAAYVGGTSVMTTVDPGLPDDEEDAHRSAGTPITIGGSSPAPSPPPPRITSPAPAPEARKPADLLFSTEPVGMGHFEASAAATIASGSSAMISVLRADAAGEQVYLYDRESPRGNEGYAFLALRFTNPTSEALEGGPFTVMREGRLLGEGIAESIPGGGAAFVPFALDRQIVAARSVEEKDEIARVVRVANGLISAEMSHVRAAKITFTSRLAEASTVFVRHTLPKGATLREAPKEREKLGASELFRVEVPARGEITIAIAEATTSARAFDPTSREGAALVKAYLAAPGGDAASKDMLSKLVAATAAVEAIEDEIRDALGSQEGLRARKGELEKQIASIGGAAEGRAARAQLARKLGETNARLVAAAVEMVELEEKRGLARTARDEAFRLAAVTPKGAVAREAASAERAPER